MKRRWPTSSAVRLREYVAWATIVGYGASPRECLDRVIEHCEVALCGNHDHAVFYEPSNFNVGAERAAYWTRQVLEDDPDKPKRDKRWEVLGNMPITHETAGLLMVHASPRRPVNEYLFPEDVYTNPGKILDNFKRLGRGTWRALWVIRMYPAYSWTTLVSIRRRSFPI